MKLLLFLYIIIVRAKRVTITFLSSLFSLLYSLIYDIPVLVIGIVVFVFFI